jgi:dTDP-4-amino-4,6-dideoxygalactose transaminase
MGEEEKQAAIAVIESNWLTSGPKIAEFEEAFLASFDDKATAVALSSATAALHLSMVALGIGPGDEVILPSLTFVACANAVRYVGATPVFADINSETDWNISAVDVTKKITNQTKAIMVVHFAGYPCDMDAFVELTTKHKLFLIEDCSHAPLAKWKGRPLGTFGDTACYSFFSNKNMTTGEGGMVITQNQELAQRFRILRSHGITASTYQRFKGHVYGYDVAELGFNYRMDEVRAAIGLEQLKKLPKFNAQRKNRVERYRKIINERLPQVKVAFADNDTESSYHIFPVLVPGGAEARGDVMKMMGEKGVQCSLHYRPIHTFSAYEGYAADVPITDKIAGSIITLPLFPSMTNEQIDLVVDILRECL